MPLLLKIAKWVIPILAVLLGLHAGVGDVVDHGLRRLVEFFRVVGMESVSWFLSLLPQGAVDTVNSVGQVLLDLQGPLDWLDWATNIYAAFTIVASAFAIVGTIRAVRWVIHLVPFIG